jgi:N-formylglutamate amidohydrolase
LRKSEDCFVDDLFAPVVDLGAPLIAATFPRAYVDVNREPYELDPDLFNERLPAFANSQSVRVVGGLGTIPRIVADGENIYRRRLSLAEGLDRIDRCYRPFHAALAALLHETMARFGTAVLVDCHSMPSASAASTPGSRPDFVVGDRFGTSCGPRVTRTVREALQRLGYDVRLNRPYAGGFITEHYGKPSHGLQAIQIEINRGLYMNETTLAPTAGFTRLSQNLTRLAQDLIAGEAWAGLPRAAAE